MHPPALSGPVVTVARSAACGRLCVWLLLRVAILRAAEAGRAAPHAACTCHLCTDLLKPRRLAFSLLHYLCCVSKGSNFPLASGPGHSQVGMEYTKGTALSGLMYGPLAGGCHLSPVPAPRARYCWGHGPEKVDMGQMRVMLSLSVIPLQCRARAMGLCWRNL